MIRSMKIIITVLCITTLSSCSVFIHEKSPPTTPIVPTPVTPDVASFTCDDLEGINRVLFVSLEYDEKYDVDADGATTVEDKIIIENDLLENSASCATSSLRTCADFDAVLADVQTWSELTVMSANIKKGVAYSVIFNESGERCADDFSTGSFIGDVNNNGYFDCNDPIEIQHYVVGLLPIDSFEPLLADINGNGTINSTDALIDRIALNALLNHSMAYLGECPVFVP